MFFQKEKLKEESKKHYAAIQAYLAAFYREEDAPETSGYCMAPTMQAPCADFADFESEKAPVCAQPSAPAAPLAQKKASREVSREEPECVVEQSDAMPFFSSEAQSLEEYLHRVRDESFSEMLLRLIDEKNMKDADCYKKAHIDKRLFSKIRSNPMYKPSKQTAMALALALELPYEQACEMLQKAGYAFSPANKGDLIVEYYIKNGIYNILLINTSLFEFDQPLIGSY